MSLLTRKWRFEDKRRTKNLKTGKLNFYLEHILGLEQYNSNLYFGNQDVKPFFLSNFRNYKSRYLSRYGGPKENTLLVALKMNLSAEDDTNSNNKNNTGEEINITWEQFLRICALHILSSRINSATERPKIPPMPIYLYSHFACMSYLEEQM